MHVTNVIPSINVMTSIRQTNLWIVKKLTLFFSLSFSTSLGKTRQCVWSATYRKFCCPTSPTWPVGGLLNIKLPFHSRPERSIHADDPQNDVPFTASIATLCLMISFGLLGNKSVLQSISVKWKKIFLQFITHLLSQQLDHQIKILNTKIPRVWCKVIGASWFETSLIHTICRLSLPINISDFILIFWSFGNFSFWYKWCGRNTVESRLSPNCTAPERSWGTFDGLCYN